VSLRDSSLASRARATGWGFRALPHRMVFREAPKRLTIFGIGSLESAE
jgi:hypothetical protein